jgi:membrane protein YdbS with pleckstrin-like domain
MNKLVAVIQLITSALVSLVALATMINLIFISTRPETISVVNTLVGQGVLIILLLVLATVLFKKSLVGLKQDKLSAKPATTP